MDRTTERLCGYTCALTFDTLPTEVVHHAKRTLIDTVGCALGGFHAQPANMARELAQRIECTRPSRILGTHCKSSPDMTSFANGCMIRYLDYNDAYASPSGGHPSDMLAAILAISEATQCDGRTTIAAMVAAYEVFCRLSDSIPVGELGWDHGTLSVIGAVCGVGKILGLDHQDLGQAISLAVVTNMPLGVTRVGELSIWKGCAAANASRAALFAAQLAELGMTGPVSPFEGRNGLMEKTLGRSIDIPPIDHEREGFRIMSNILKFFPCQTHTQGPISLALELRLQMTVQDITSIRIRTYGKAVSTAATEAEKWAPNSRETADHSIPYLVAHAFQHGAVTPSSFTDDHLKDPHVLELIKRIRVEEEADFSKRFSKEYNCHMEVTTKFGEKFTAAIVHPKGFPGNSLSDTAVEEKFRSLAYDLLSVEQATRALEILWSFENAPNVNPLFESLVVAT
ncbi:MAG: MmgE/PrpD family protein [Nitrospirales bacterium]